MDPHSFIARAEAQRWLGIAEKLLMGHDLVGSKTFAIRARDSDPRLEAADQILAIADTLLSSEKPVVGNNGGQQPDYYAILQLVRFAQDTEQIASQYRRLAVILNPHQNRFPYSDQAFQLVNDAWAVLSNPMRKSIYDSELEFPPPTQQQQQQMNTIGFNLEHQQHHHHHNQQQQQHNFFSLNHMGSGHEQETFQSRVQHQSHPHHQQLQQHNFLSQPTNPVRVREEEQMFQHREQVQPFQVTSAPLQQQQHNRPSSQPTLPPQPQPSIQSPTPPPPAAPPQPPFSWPQAPPLSQQQQQHLQPPPFKPQALPQPQPLPKLQPEQQLQHNMQHLSQEQEQEESLEQNADPVELPSEVNVNNGVRDEELERETEEVDEEVDDDSPTFWTACPFCFYMYEYPKIYAECTLCCDNCKRASQAVRVPSPPSIIQGQEASFYCWGFFPVGVSMSHLEKNNVKGTKSKWTPFSLLCEASSNVQDHLNGRAAPEENLFVNKSSGPRIYIDDITDDIFVGISDPSDSSDAEWNTTKKKKVKRTKKGLKRAFKKRAQVIDVRVKDGRSGSNKNMENGSEDQEGEGVVATVSVAEGTKKAVGSNTRRQSGRVAKELGKLDLNVEFNNNEGEEPAPRMTVGNRGHGQGEEDNIEGIGFFEGLDEFLSSLPILSVVNDEKVKAA